MMAAVRSLEGSLLQLAQGSAFANLGMHWVVVQPVECLPADKPEADISSRLTQQMGTCERPRGPSR